MARGDDIQSLGVVIDPVVSRQVVRVRLDLIDASERLREVSEAHAVVMAASMAERGQRTPIEIVRRGDRFRATIKICPVSYRVLDERLEVRMSVRGRA